MERLVCLAIGYCFGLFQTAYFYGKMKGIDIRQYGSGNAGTTNTLRVLGTKAGLIVLLGDIVKTILAVVVATLLFKESHPDTIYLLKLYAGMGAILGHNFPFYMNFKGGKGIAATAGVILGLLDWRIICVCLTAFLLTVVITRYVSLGSLIVVTLFFVSFLVLGYHGAIVNTALNEPYLGNELIESYVIIFLFASLAFYRHKANIVRLVQGNENKLFDKKKDE